MSYFKDKRVVITGAGGSIGSKLCELILKEQPDEMRLLSLTESALYNVMKTLRPQAGVTTLVPVLGSVTDSNLLDGLLEDQHIVIHAAAHKHVPLCEENVCAAINNNVFGTKALLETAIEMEVPQFLLVSTDKAVRPSSVMGATKRIAELLVGKAAKQHPGLGLYVVRFGNVLDSAGSVLPLWREQAAKGGPITITDKRCTRYFMSIPEACELIMNVLSMRAYSGTYVFDMGEPKNMYDLAIQIALEYHIGGIVETGLRPGEKLTEELDHGGERIATMHPKIYRIDEDPAEAYIGMHGMTTLEHLAGLYFEDRAREQLMEMAR